jgi:carboxypeptidase PM20D1
MTSCDPVGKLAAIVAIPTVSHHDPRLTPVAEFDRLLAAMAELWPRVHALEVTRVGTHGLLIRWPGRRADQPVVLMAHLDVVPVVASDWSRDPFGAQVTDGAIWGRGTLDDKGCVAAICEAAETLLARGLVPARDVWLSFGCDEEVTSACARAAVGVLRSRGVRPWLVLDEGGAIAGEAFPGVAAPVGVVGVTEKGLTSIRLSVTGGGGHASTPARNGPAVRLARAITRLDRAPMTPRLPEPTIEMFRRLAPHASVPLRVVLGNAGRLTPAVGRLLALAGPEAAALARTTFAITTLEGAPARNVIPATAAACVNIRVLPGDTVASVLEHVRSAIDDDKVAVELIEGEEPWPVSPYSVPGRGDEGFDLVTGLISEVFPEAVPAPYVVLATTDSRFFTAISDRVYRFAPLRMSKAQRAAIHAADEHLDTSALLAAIDWYRRLIESLPGN